MVISVTPARLKAGYKKEAYVKKTSLLFSTVSLFFATAMPASAATLLYSFSPATTAAPRFTFNVDSNPFVVNATDFQFTTSVQNLTIAGVARSGTFDFTFVADAVDGGFESTIVGSYLGPQLFSGSSRAPTLQAGTFDLFGGPGDATGRLTVTTVAAAIPEPGTWSMMAIGFGVVGLAMRRRKIATRISYTINHS